jgi:hypothetical protein
VDFCRAVAAAVVGDAEKVTYFPLLTTARFLVRRSNEVDLLARNTTWTIRREAGLGVHFVGTLYYDGQGFMVSRKGRTKKIADLKGTKICVLEKTTAEENLADYFSSRGWKYQPVLSKSIDDPKRGQRQMPGDLCEHQACPCSSRPPASEILAGWQTAGTGFKSRPCKIMSYLFQISQLQPSDCSTSDSSDRVS